jgi:hypothetical protein
VALSALFSDADQIDTILAKILTPNDDSGRHGVLIPVGAYSVFPKFPDFEPDIAVNHTVAIKSHWPEENNPDRNSSYKHYHRYPERRITALGSAELNSAPPQSLIIVGRKRGTDDDFEIHLLRPTDQRYQQLLRDLGFKSTDAGAFVLQRDWTPRVEISENPGLTELLNRFDKLKSLGFVTTARGGDTAVGHTFELHMGVQENNLETADFEGIELKAIRRSDFDRGSPERTNLFLKEPKWIDGLGAAERVRAYGYISDLDREALYSCVSSKENSHGLKLRVDHNEQRVYVDFEATPVGYYSFEILEKRLKEKLPDMFVGLASTQGTGSNEAFLYHSAIFCSNPSVTEFVSLIENGDVMLEIRMHVTPSGACRNHGSGFRIKMNKWPELFATVREVRAK